jgi:hypothetical protein
VTAAVCVFARGLASRCLGPESIVGQFCVHFHGLSNGPGLNNHEVKSLLKGYQRSEEAPEANSDRFF